MSADDDSDARHRQTGSLVTRFPRRPHFSAEQYTRSPASPGLRQAQTRLYTDSRVINAADALLVITAELADTTAPPYHHDAKLPHRSGHSRRLTLPRLFSLVVFPVVFLGRRFLLRTHTHANIHSHAHTYIRYDGALHLVKETVSRFGFGQSFTLLGRFHRPGICREGEPG